MLQLLMRLKHLHNEIKRLSTINRDLRKHIELKASVAMAENATTETQSNGTEPLTTLGAAEARAQAAERSLWETRQAMVII